ncbi:hypothetical protein DFJ67_3514 [Asanoa ferruginea]|uniref:Uncharacterized protein n=2 Tax=Asanoa ferruginea TaxID=53367 RepID=A0A3D9ZNI7_9ACTN|nr:hypothetical protein DFJ67_3514 [Asanoa ferruginea]
MLIPDQGGEDAAVRRGERTLIASASAWMQEALLAWSEDDFRKVSAVAPLGVEHLGKAVLWRTAPILLVPLSRDAELALFSLATKPDLDDPRLKTIGLSGVFERLLRLLPAVAIDDKAVKRMVGVRNGAMHVGTSSTSRNVLLDSLVVCRVLLEHLGHDLKEFYGEHLSSARGLMDAKRTEVGDRVAAKRAKAARDLANLQERMGIRFDDWIDDKELEAEELSPSDFGTDLWGMEQDCPECGHRGRLFGRVEADPQIEERPPVDETTPPEAYLAGWIIEFYPEAFMCCVCEFTLHGRDEVAEASLPSGRQQITAEDLGGEFDPAAYTEQRNSRWN